MAINIYPIDATLTARSHTSISSLVAPPDKAKSFDNGLAIISNKIVNTKATTIESNIPYLIQSIDLSLFLTHN